MGKKQVTSGSIIHTDLHKANKLVNEQLEHVWCIDEPWAKMDSQDSP
jgi:predicted unusual protein kinase regulating ubiquinone biosynthesis (AarF/ABC1/UbiB family)